MLRGYDPLKEIHHWHLVMFLLVGEFLLASLLLSPFLTGFSSINAYTWSPQFILGLLLAYSLLAITLLIMARRSLRSEKKQRDPLRQGALNRDSQLLAPIQPPPHAQALALPLHIEGRLRWPFIWLLIGGAVIFASMIVLDIWILLGNPPDLAFLVSSGSAIAIQIPLWISRAIQKVIAGHYLLPALQVDEDGISARYGRDTISMHWEDVRYFALASSMTFRGTGQREAFELSDGENMICWLVAEPFSAYNLLWSSGAPSSTQVTLSAQDYASFTQQLSSLIVAKTGRPLCDLRLPKHKKKSRQARPLPMAPMTR